MLLPNNGRLAIVDDKINEVQPLFDILSKRRIPYNYYSGDRRQLPDDPNINPVTAVFLDLNIVESQHKHTVVIGTLHPILKAICPGEGHPYFLIIWSKKIADYAEHLVSHFEKNKELKNRKPVTIIYLNKGDYFEYDDGEYKFNDANFSKLVDEINSNLNDLSLLKNLIRWENIVHTKSAETIAEFTSFFPLDKDWDKNTKAIIYHLAKSIIGTDDIDKKISKTIEGVPVEVLKYNDEQKLSKAFLCMSSFLAEKVESEIDNLKLGTTTDITDDSISKRNKSGKLTLSICGRINSKLHLVVKKNDDNMLEQGNIYILNHAKGIAKKILSKPKYENLTAEEIINTKPKIAKLDITPVCDYSQNKGYVRKIYGLVIDQSFNDSIKASEQYYYKTPIFDLNNKQVFILFDFRFVLTTSEEEIIKSKIKPQYKLRREICTDIQSQLANQVNRPGISNL